jgi:hypothetical protein
MDNSAKLASDLVVRLILALPAIYFLIRGFTPGPRSRRLANLSLFCGLMVFVTPENLVSNLWPVNRSFLLFVSGCLRILFGSSGLGLAATAFFARHDGGVTWAQPIAGGGVSLLQFVAGVGMLLLSSFNRPETQRVFQSPDGAYSLILPSERWKQVPVPDRPGRIAFVHQVPFMQATVLAVNPQQSEADFLRTAESVRGIVEERVPQGSRPQWQQGTNLAGNPYQYVTVIESPASDEPVFVAHSTTWCRQKGLVVQVIVECAITARSEMAKTATMEAAQNAADKICLSVE